MKCLITGGNGFIGSAVVRKFLNNGCKVINLDSLTYAGNAPHPDHPNYRFHKGSICDQQIIREILFREKPNAVIHLAAETHVDNSISNPEIFIETNVLGTFRLLEACREYLDSSVDSRKNFKVVHVSTG